jgi:hypothetical protein
MKYKNSREEELNNNVAPRLLLEGLKIMAVCLSLTTIPLP